MGLFERYLSLWVAAAIAAFLLGISDIIVPSETLLISVLLYVLIPLVAGVAIRGALDRGDDHSRLNGFLARSKPFSILGLLCTVVLLFGLRSGAALATVVGVLVEVPVMLSLVAFTNRTRHWFDQGTGRQADTPEAGPTVQSAAEQG